MAEYYIEVDTYWQGSTSYFVGPFANRSGAEAWHQQDTPHNANVWYSTSFCGGDIKSAWRVYPAPLTKTEARRRGLDVHHTIAPCTPPTAAALGEAVAELVEEARW